MSFEWDRWRNKLASGDDRGGHCCGDKQRNQKEEAAAATLSRPTGRVWGAAETLFANRRVIQIGRVKGLNAIINRSSCTGIEPRAISFRLREADE